VTYTPSITTDQVFTGLAAWLSDALGLVAGTTVLQELQNRAAAPAGGFVNMLHKAQKRLAGNEVDYSPTAGTTTTTQATEFAIQVDAYGAASGDWASIIATMWASPLAIDFLASYGITPLWADNPLELSIVDSEDEFEERWITVLHLQYAPSMTASAQFCEAAHINVINALTL